MTGQIIHLFSRRNFVFSQVQSGTVLKMPIVKAVDVSQYTQGTLEVRVHSTQISGSSAFITVVLYPTAPSVEAPSTDFVGVSAVATSTAVDSSTVAPTLIVQSLSANFGGMVTVEVHGQQPGVAVTDLEAELSAILTLKR